MYRHTSIRATQMLAASIAIGCCGSCFLPVPTVTGYRAPEGTLHLINSETQEEISEALVLAYTTHSGSPSRRMSNAFVYQSNDTFPMFHNAAVLIMGPCPQPVCETRTGGFVVIVSGYAPKFFAPEPRRKGDARVDWPLRPLNTEHSKESLRELREALARENFLLSNLTTWDKDDEQNVFMAPTEVVRIALSSGERHTAASFIDDALAKLQ